MRILKFIGVFLAVFIVMAAIIIIPSLKSVRTIIKNFDNLDEGSQWLQQVSTTEGFLNYIEAHPQRVSIYSYTPGEPDSTLDYHGEKMRSVGTLSVLVSVAAYAHMIDTGKWRADDPVPIDSLNHYQLPGVFMNTHREDLSELPKSDTGKHIVRLGEIVRMAVQGQDLAASDYLYQRIGAARLDSTLRDLGIKNLEGPMPWTGLYITINPKVNHQSAKQLLHNLTKKDRKEQRAIITNNFRKFNNDPAFHNLVLKAFRKDGTGLTFAQERTAYSFLPRATTRSLVELIKKAWQDSLYNSNTSKIFLQALKWRNMAPLMKKVFTWYGSSFDNRMSLLSGVDVGTTTRFGYTRIQSMVLDSLPIQLWMHLSSQFSNQTLERRLIWDPSFFRAAYDRLILHKTLIDSIVINTQRE